MKRQRNGSISKGTAMPHSRTEHPRAVLAPGIINRLGEKRRPLDEVRDFNPMRRALKELDENDRSNI
jgi:hypothetical protein